MVGGVIAAGKAKKASKKAAKAQIAGMEKGIGEQRSQLATTTGNFQPWLQGGTQAQAMYGNLVGTGGMEAQQAAIDQLKNSPFYTSLYRNGLEANLQSASATGGLRGGNEVRSLADFGADTLATTIDRQLSALGGMSQMGYNSANALGGFGQNTAGNVTNLLTGQGQAKAQDYLNRGAISANMWQGIGSGLDQMAKDVAMAMAGVPPGMGGGGGGGGGFDYGALFGQPGMFAQGGGSSPLQGFGGTATGNMAALNAMPMQSPNMGADPFGWGSI